MARIVGNRIVPDEIIEQDTWRENMNPQNQRGNYGINTLGNAPFAGLQQSAFPNMADVSGPEYLEDVLNMNQNLDDQEIYTRQKGEPFLAENRGNILKNLINPEVNWRGYQRGPNDFNFPSVMGGIMNAVKDQFEYRPATEEAWDPNTGEFISAEDQDRQNALGGYYSDAARNQRRQRARVINMMKRRDADKGYSEKNLKRLQDLGYGEKITDTIIEGTTLPGTGGATAGPDMSIRGFNAREAQRAAPGGYSGRGGSGSGPQGGAGYGPWRAEGGRMAQGGRIGYQEGELVEDEYMA